RCRARVLRHGWHGYRLGALSHRHRHIVISLGCRFRFKALYSPLIPPYLTGDIKPLLEATNDVAQRALTRFRRGCARITTGHLPGGANAIVVMSQNSDDRTRDARVIGFTQRYARRP